MHLRHLIAQAAAIGVLAGDFLSKNGLDKKAQLQSNKVPRNDPCPCGSGKKYKHCHYLIDATK